MKHTAIWKGQKKEISGKEPRLLDPTYLLTNMRVHVTTKEMHLLSASAFVCVSKFDDNILSRPIVTDLQDKQSTTIAMKVFYEDVQKINWKNLKRMMKKRNN